MRGQELLHILTKLDVKLVNEAAAPRRKRHTAWRLLAVAACLAVVAGTVLWQVTWTQPPQADLPMLTIEALDPTFGIGSGNLGVEWVNTLDDIPTEYLTVSDDGTLPVYTSEALSTDPQVIRQRVLKAGELLAMGDDAVLTATTSYGTEIEEKLAYRFCLENESIKLESDRDSTGVQIRFREPVPFPENVAYQYPLSKEETEELVPFFEELCREKLNMPSPEIAVQYWTTDAYGEQIFSVSCTQEELFDVSFGPIGAEAELTYCWLYFAREYLGDYPIINEKEALERLEAGHYLGLPGYGTDERQVEERVDLLYYADQFQTVLMPYYRFFAFIHTFKSDDAEATISVYEEYYVPAVASEYLTALPEDGSAGGLPALPDATTTTTTTADTTTTTQPPNVPLVPVLPDNYGVLLRLYDGPPVYKTTAHAETIARARKLIDGATLKQAPDQEPIAGGWQLHVDFPDGTGYVITADGVVIGGTRYLPDDPDALIAAAEALWEDVDVPAESLLNYRPYTGE